MKNCLVAKVRLPPRPFVTFWVVKKAALTVRSAPSATRKAPSTEVNTGAVATAPVPVIVPKKTTGAEPAETRALLPIVCVAATERILPEPMASWVPPEVAKVTSVLAPSILSALMPRKLRPGLLRAAVSAVTR